LSLSLSICNLVPERLCSFPCPCPCEFCHDYFNGLLWKGIISTLIYCQKSQQITFKVTLIANGQLSALMTPRINSR
jgi:hypothetical protein